MRLFVAINFSPGTRSRLLTLRDELRSRSLRGNFSAPENLHLTLAFLGECDAIQTTAAKAAMDGVNFAPFPVEIERLGRFRRDGGDIWWAGVRESRRLLGLQRDLTDKLVLPGSSLNSANTAPILPWEGRCKPTLRRLCFHPSVR